jgi:hypothetical protein
MVGVDIDDLQGDVAPAECLTNWGDGCGMALLQKKQAVSQPKGRSTGPGLFGEVEDATIEPAVFLILRTPIVTASLVIPSCPGGTRRIRLPSGSTMAHGVSTLALAMISL